jgi:hypothetical protein
LHTRSHHYPHRAHFFTCHFAPFSPPSRVSANLQRAR